MKRSSLVFPKPYLSVSKLGCKVLTGLTSNIALRVIGWNQICGIQKGLEPLVVTKANGHQAIWDS